MTVSTPGPVSVRRSGPGMEDVTSRSWLSVPVAARVASRPRRRACPDEEGLRRSGQSVCAGRDRVLDRLAELLGARRCTRSAPSSPGHLVVPAPRPALNDSCNVPAVAVDRQHLHLVHGVCRVRAARRPREHVRGSGRSQRPTAGLLDQLLQRRRALSSRAATAAPCRSARPGTGSCTTSSFRVTTTLPTPRCGSCSSAPWTLAALHVGPSHAGALYARSPVVSVATTFVVVGGVDVRFWTREPSFESVYDRPGDGVVADLAAGLRPAIQAVR